MTTKATPAVNPPPPTIAAPPLAQFPDFPPRTDMMNTAHIHDDGNQAALRLHLGNPDTTVVLGEVPIYWDVPANRAGVRVPDLLIAFNIRRACIIEQKGYSILEQGKPPDFVLEVASDSTANNDETGKWRDYANFGITEYWLYDPDWGRRYARGLTGWTLRNGRYEPIPIYQPAPDLHYGRSAVLRLAVCWEYGKLRWHAPETGYLWTHAEERSGRIAERDQRIAEQNMRIAERNRRIAEQNLRIAERDRRIAAETQRDAAISEAQRLRDEINRLRNETDRT